MTSREIVARTIRFQGACRLPYDFPPKYGSDFIWIFMNPSPDERPRQGIDEWGVRWENIGRTSLGTVKEYPLKHWREFSQLIIPDIHDSRRWQHLERIREQAGEKFILAHGISIFERVHFIRGLENTWLDIYDSPTQLEKLIDILVEMNLAAIERFTSLGADGFIFPDDWGLQKSLMISPVAWRHIWKPKYARIYDAAHQAGLFTFLHSCGYILDILDDLIECGLDVIQLDQQENMGLKRLCDAFGGRITFFSPVDIQNTMVNGSLEEIQAYCRQMVEYLNRPNGGFIPRWYSDPTGAGHRQAAIDAMCEEFLKLSAESGTVAPESY